MAENLLEGVLNARIQRKRLFEWLEGVRQELGEQKFGCSQGEFISHFLNYVHEKAPCFDKLNDTPRKVHTPKSIRKVHLSKSESKINRRPALFPEAGGSKGGHLVELNCPRGSDCSIPVSPIYARGQTSTPRYKGRVHEERTLADFIVISRPRKVNRQLLENVEPQETTRRLKRINPTNVNRKLNRSFDCSGNSFDFREDVAPEICPETSPQERNMLAIERLRITDLNKSETALPLIPIKPAIGKEIDPDFTLVTHKDHMERLIDVYVYLLSNNFVLNIASEVFFLLSLALTKQFSENRDVDLKNSEEVSPSEMFPNIHNTVYFAIRVLETQIDVLKLLDKSCLKFLCSNERLKSISTKLSLYTDDMCRETTQDVEEKSTHVCFMSETDNRENFPSDPSFHAFKKQRDLFYEILRVWEQQRFLEGWNYGIALGGKIKTLLGLYNDAANFRHFCRLFKAQLLTTCGKTNVEGITEDRLSFLSTIPNVDSEKLNRLKSRLVTKTNTNGINALPTFPGHQEFYKEFIVTASKHVFNVHLRNTLLEEILELNDTKFGCNELEDEDTFVDSTTRHSYLHCVKSLRLLAKFLGFVDSIPYRKYANIPDKVISAEIKTRAWERPVFDLKRVLDESRKQGALSLTIPWVTKYLSMLDYVTLRLSYFETVLDVLFEVFRETRCSYKSRMLVSLCLGWLFELPHFPSELYYAWYTKQLNRGAKTLSDVSARFQLGLDSLDVVDKDVVYCCCPYLNEFKTLLQYNCAKNGTITVKHITPLSAVESPLQVNEKRLKLQLEDAFFNAHPNSVRKTVEFVSERVASACVKNICTNLVPRCKAEAVKAFKTFLKLEHRKFEAATPNFQSDVKSKCADFLQDHLRLLREKCNSEIETQVTSKIETAMSVLLSDEETSQTKCTCSAVASRLCRDRVRQWTNTHINENVFNKEFDAEFTRYLEHRSFKEPKIKLSFALPTLGRPRTHDPESWSAVLIVDKLRLACIETIESPPMMTLDAVVHLLDGASRSLKNRCDINDCIRSVIARLLLDFIVILISQRPDICDSNILTRLITFWTEEEIDVAIFNTVICPRNTRLFGQSQTSWDLLARFISLLFAKKLLDYEEFETQCLSIYRQNWDPVTLKCLSSCLRSVVEEHGKTTSKSSRFTFLLAYLSDFCSDLEF